MRAYQQAQREAQQRMNEFLSLASHDLKTPLTSVKGNIQLVTRRLQKMVGGNNTSLALANTNEMAQTLIDAREVLERTDQQVTRLTKLVNTLLESARSTTSNASLLLEVSDLDTLVREVAQELHHLPETRHILLALPESKAIVVMVDTQRIKQVLHHYLSNAHKFSSINHPIEIRLQNDGCTAFVFVHDEGQGIPETAQSHVWEQFYRVPGIQVHNGTEVGLGLGLHICRSIIEQHRGKVGLQSKPGSGSTFWFSLPIWPNVL